jgi:purine-nucleoside phosphorylase
MDYKKFFNFCYGCETSHVAGTAIISPFLSSDIFKKHYENVSPFKGRLFSGFIAASMASPLMFVQSGMGDRLTGDAVMLLRDTNIERIIFLGACGGFREANIGDIVLCENAFNGEGFSRYHSGAFTIEDIFVQGELVEANTEYTKELGDFLDAKKEGATLRRGNVFTIGSLLAETRENLLDIEKRGFIGIDMELSAVFQAAKSIGKSVAGLAVVSDLPITRPISEDLTDEENKSYNASMKRAVKYLAEFTSGGKK